MAPQAAHWIMDMTELQVNRISSALRDACDLAVAFCSTTDLLCLRCAYFVTSEKALATTHQGQRARHRGRLGATIGKWSDSLPRKDCACGLRRAMTDRGRPSANREMSE